jgi:hypothetical protein
MFIIVKINTGAALTLPIAVWPGYSPLGSFR